MTAQRTGSTRSRRRRPIDRPRLTRSLDACEERVILLHAPAGYGKTTLARQWTKTLSGVLWLSLTPAHRDVAAFAHDLARPLGRKPSAFVDEYLRARPNPQRQPREVARALAARIEAARIRWIALDDYHEVVESPEIEQMVEVVRERTGARFLVASRVRPRWARARSRMYGHVAEFDRDALAMDEAESRALVGRPRDPALQAFLAQARGWPAVLALAGAPAAPPLPPHSVLPSELHRYLAEELYQSASVELREHLVDLALLPHMTRKAMQSRFGDAASAVLGAARERGFVSTGEDLELHPLLREFLLQKLLEDMHSEEKVRAAVTACIDAEAWDRALELVLRFSLLDLVEEVLGASYKPLVRAGRLESISRFSSEIRAQGLAESAAVDLVDADVALRDGAYSLAREIAGQVSRKLPPRHVLRPRAWAIAGHAASALADFSTAERAYSASLAEAEDQRDEGDALYGLTLARIYGEQANAQGALPTFAARADCSPLDVVRHAVVQIASRRIGPGFLGEHTIDAAMHALPRVEDPLVRTGFTVTYAYALGIQAKYDAAHDIASMLLRDVDAFDLEFARPHAHWNLAFSALGLRRFGDAERHLQLVEDAVKERGHGHHSLNARVLRARLLLQLGQPQEALGHVQYETDDVAAVSMHGEYAATRALVHAVLGDEEAAIEAADRAARTTISCEVRLLAQAARSVLASQRGDAPGAARLVSLARELAVWDPVVVALRSEPQLAAILAAQDDLRPILQRLYENTNDLALSRKAGLRTRSGRIPGDLLSAREIEVLGLLSRGLRDKEIAAALVIAESTAKAHVRNVFRKLGVRNRAEAVSRYRMFES